MLEHLLSQLTILFKRKSFLLILILLSLFSNSTILLLLCLTSLILIYLFYQGPKYGKRTILCLLILNIFVCYSTLEQNNNIAVESSTNDITVHFISTGNSDSILIEASGHFTLIDTGEWNDQLLLYQYLKNTGVKQLDNLIITHYHADHIGSATTIIKTFNPKTTYIPNGSADTYVYNKFIQSVNNATVPLENTQIPFGEATLTFYNTTGYAEKENNNSLITLLQYGNDRLLFMADAEKEVEAQVTFTDIDLLKIGHHGSYTSSTYEFLKQANPSMAVITVGKNNPYAHPHKSTMIKLETLDIPVYRTDEQGHLKFLSTGDGIQSMQDVGSYAPGAK